MVQNSDTFSLQVCVPIDPKAAWDFDPDEVPTVHDLIDEVKAGASGPGMPHWERTSLAPSIRIFQDGFLQPLQRACQKLLNDKARSNGAINSGITW